MLDAGATTLQESPEMVRLYEESGVKKVVATPHFLPGTAWAAPKSRVLESVDQLQRVIDRCQIEVEVLPGMEIGFHAKLECRIEDNEVLSLGDTNFYLIEPPFYGSQENLLRSLHSLLDKEYRCILAHPERIEGLINRLDDLNVLVERGLVVQLTADSLLGRFGTRTREISLGFWQQGCAQIVASDAHGVHKRPPISRTDWRHFCDGPITREILAEGNKKLVSMFQ